MEMTCSVVTCDSPAVALSWCKSHLSRYYRTGDIKDNVPLRKRRQGCQFDGCTRKHFGRGWCNFHYKHVIKGQEPRANRLRAPAGSGHLQRNGYRTMSINGKNKFEHRLVMEQILGRPLFKDENVHHINGVKYDNRPENLELWSSSQPPGQRIEDKLKWAHEIINRYEGK